MRRTTLMLTSVGVLVATTALAIAISACGGSDTPPATNPSAYPPQQGGYYPPAGGQTAYPQQTGAYPQPGPQQPAPPAPGPQPTAGGAMATPGPLALPCTADNACGLHRCNTQFQKCAFPCQTATDCAPNNQCMMGVCAPSMGH